MNRPRRALNITLTADSDEATTVRIATAGATCTPGPSPTCTLESMAAQEQRTVLVTYRMTDAPVELVNVRLSARSAAECDSDSEDNRGCGEHRRHRRASSGKRDADRRLQLSIGWLVRVARHRVRRDVDRLGCDGGAPPPPSGAGLADRPPTGRGISHRRSG